MLRPVLALLALIFAGLTQPLAAQDREVPYWASIDATELYMRRGPSADFRIDWVYKRPGMPLKIIRIVEGWGLAVDPQGTKGWVSRSLLSDKRGVIVIGKGLAAMRAEPTSSAQLRWNAQPGVIGKLGECAGGWCKVDVGGRVGWIKADRLWGAGEP